jgi:hypothetical protein
MEVRIASHLRFKSKYVGVKAYIVLKQVHMTLQKQPQQQEDKNSLGAQLFI